MPTAEELSQLRQLAEIGYRSQLQQPVQQPQQVQPSQPAHPVTGVEPMTDEELSYIQRDASGNLVVAPGAPAGLLEKYHRHEAGIRRFYREFARDPGKALGKLIEERSQEVAKKLYEETVEGRRHQEAANRIRSEVQNWVYVKDAQGNPVRDFWGNPKMTPEGSAYIGFVEKLYAGGMKDPDELHRTAQLMLVGHLYQARQASQPQQTQQAQQPQLSPDQLARQDLLNRAAAAATTPLSGSAPATGNLNPARPRSLKDVINETALAFNARA